jgi:hypothetical protein
MIDKLNEEFVGLRATNHSYFTGEPKPSDGIWLKCLADLDSTVFTPWGDIETMEPNPMGKFLEARGWFMEPYDSMTVMAWRM